MNGKIKVGIIGCGTIGTEIARACVFDLKKKVNLVSVYDINRKKLEVFDKFIGRKTAALSLEELFRKCSLVIEAANPGIVTRLLRKAISGKKDIMIMSVGGLLGSEKLLRTARAKGVKVYMPSGAIAGIDALKSANLSNVSSVNLTTKKPIRGLEGAPFLKKKKIDIHKVKGEKVLFKGNAEQAVKAFPKNINVSALLSLAGLGARRTRVKIIASSLIHRNIHEVEIKGDFGTIRTVTENVPSPRNPKTSFLAALSAVATLKGIVDSVRIGT